MPIKGRVSERGETAGVVAEEVKSMVKVNEGRGTSRAACCCSTVAYSHKCNVETWPARHPDSSWRAGGAAGTARVGDDGERNGKGGL